MSASSPAVSSSVAGPGRWGRPVPLGHVLGAVLVLAGSAAVLLSLFGPWLVSGGVTRNSLALVGLLERYRFGHGVLYDVATTTWPLLGPVAVLVAAVTVLRLRVPAVVLAALLALAVGAAGVAALTQAGRRIAGVAVVTTGPWTGVVAAALLLTGAALLLVRTATTLEVVRPVRG